MGFSSDRKALMEPRKKKPVDEGPSLYKGEKKKDINWGRLEDFGDTENPLSLEKSRKELVLFGIILFVFLNIVMFIAAAMELPIRGLGMHKMIISWLF